MRLSKHLITAFTIALIVINLAHAKSYNIPHSCDSIKQTIHHKDLQGKYKSYMELADLYRFLNSDSVIKYANHAYSSAIMLGNAEFKAESLYLLGMDYYKNNNFNKSISLIKLGVLYSKYTKNKVLEGIGYLRLAQNNYAKEDYNKAIELFGKAFLLFDSAGSYEYKCHIIDILGYIYMDYGNLEEAKRFFYIEKKLLTYDPKPYLIALSNLHYSLALIKQKKTDKVKAYLDAALMASQESRDIPRTASIEREICSYYYNKGHHYSAINKLKESIKMAKHAGILYEEASSLNLLAFFYQQLGLNHLAFEAQKGSLALRKKLDYTKLVCNATINMAEAFANINNKDSAIHYYMLGLKLATSKGITSEQIRACKKLAAYYEKNGNDLDALTWNEKHQKLRIKFIEKQSFNYANLLQNNYLQQIRMEELSSIEHNRKLNYNLIALIATLILILIIGTSIYGYFQFRKKTHLQSELKYRLLLSQLYPRFIYESIGTLKQEIQSDSLEESGTKLADFARLIRTILINPANNIHLLQRELDSMEAYFSLQKIRLAPKLSYTVEVDPQVDPTIISIPPFLGHLLADAWITLAQEMDTQNLYIHSKFSISNNMLTQTFYTNIPFINRPLYGHLRSHDDLGSSLQLLKKRLRFLRKSLGINIKFQLTQTISTVPAFTHCYAKFSLPIHTAPSISKTKV